MHITNLHKVGGSIVLVVPTAFLKQLRIQIGTTVSPEMGQGKPIIEPPSKPHDKLAELLAASDYS